MIPQNQIPRFGKDIFLSYSHIDRDWVDALHERLLLRLGELIGERPEIWRDIQMENNVDFPEVLVLKLSEIAFLISVLSPGYVKSTWCVRELDGFCRNAAKNWGIKINNKSRVFKVIKYPIEGFGYPTVLRELLQEVLDYKFYERDKLTGKLKEYRPELGQESNLKWLGRVEELVADIGEFIRCQNQDPAAFNCKKNIYLAETTPDLREERNEIKSMLQQHAYHVLPDDSLPFEVPAFEEKVRHDIGKSTLSIHLIGPDFTVVRAEEELRSRLNLQYQMAAERVRKQHELAMRRGKENSEYSRLIWMPKDLKAQGESYQEFIAYLENEPEVYEGAEVLSGTKLEDLKTIIQNKLKFRHEESAGDDKPKIVYLYCDKQDLGAVEPIRAYLAEQKYGVLLSFDREAKVNLGHNEKLRLCDAVLAFYGSTNTIQYKLEVLRKIEVFRDDKPLLAQGIYIGGPETEHKRAFQTDEALLMKNFGNFTPDSIMPFLEQIDKSL